MYKVDWPSESKLLKLREEGKVPMSKFACSCAALIAVGLCAQSEREDWSSFTGTLGELFSKTSLSREDVLTSLESLADPVVSMFLVPVVSVMIAVIVLGLAQTKFLYRMSLLSFHFRRISPFKFPDLAKILYRMLLAVTGWCVFLVIGAWLVWFFMSLIFEPLVHNAKYFVSWPWKSYLRVAPFVLTVVAAIAGISWFVERFHFMVTHMMTREEVEQEARESE